MNLLRCNWTWYGVPQNSWVVYWKQYVYSDDPS